MGISTKKSWSTVHASYFDYKKQSDWSKLDGNISVKCNKMWRHTSSYWCQGCLPVPISIIVQPRLQISTSKLYPFLFIITWRIWSTSHNFSWRWKPYMANSSNVIDRKHSIPQEPSSMGFLSMSVFQLKMLSASYKQIMWDRGKKLKRISFWLVAFLYCKKIIW